MSKKKRPSRNPLGKPPLDIDPVLVEKWARAHCTMQEIAEGVGCSVATLERRFADVIRKARAGGKTSLRILQFKSAENGSTEMLKWLGRCILKQNPEALEEDKQLTSLDNFCDAIKEKRESDGTS